MVHKIRPFLFIMITLYDSIYKFVCLELSEILFSSKSNRKFVNTIILHLI